MTTASNYGPSVTDLLDAVLNHMDGYELPEPYGVQARAYTSRDSALVSIHLVERSLSTVASVLVIWADTLSEVSLSAWRPPARDTVHIHVSGRLAGGVPIEVWAGVKAPVPPVNLEPDQKKTLRLGLLRTWIAAPANDEHSTTNARAEGTA